MKITKQYLIQVIKEEAQRFIKENEEYKKYLNKFENAVTQKVKEKLEAKYPGFYAAFMGRRPSPGEPREIGRAEDAIRVKYPRLFSLEPIGDGKGLAFINSLPDEKVIDKPKASDKFGMPRMLSKMWSVEKPSNWATQSEEDFNDQIEELSNDFMGFVDAMMADEKN